MKDVYKVIKMDHTGRGIIKVNNKIAFVNNALIGDEITIKINNEKKTYIEADVDEYIRKSDLRRKGFCKYYDICGGCNIGMLKYYEQLKYKEEKIQNIVKKYLKEDIKINKIIYSNDLNYRNKVTLHIKDNKIGFYKNGTNTLVEINYCELVDSFINEIINRLSIFIKKYKNDLKEVTIRCSSNNQGMLIFKGSIDEKIVLNEFIDINVIYINNKLLKGKYIEEEIGDYKFVITQDSFFQVNKYNTEKLYNEVLRFINNKKINSCLDLYCGTGTIGIYISNYFKKVLGIEQNKNAIDSALINKKINKVNNIDFVNSKVEDYIDKLNDFDCIITDPPRSGMDNNTINNIKRINPKYIIYVSCDPMTLIRDLLLLKDKYSIKEITPVDMFPNTYHCESVCILER